MKRMLINATHQEDELRIALVDGQYVYDLDIESASHKQTKANIYKGRITRIEPSLEAAFVDYGATRHGFLPLKEVVHEYYPENLSPSDRPNIKDVLKEGQELIVQVEKEERGNKGAALTTSITLPGSYLVLMPSNTKAGGVSRRIEGEDRQNLKEILSAITYPKEMGLIVRTAGAGKSQEELQWDLDILLHHWEAIKKVASEHDAPLLIYQESNGIIRAIRDYLRHDIDEIVIDNKDAFEQAKNHIQAIRPAFVDRIKLYEGQTPLFTRFQVEAQIESAFAREVKLPSGGSIVIDHTEALVAIDINSAKSTKGTDIEDTALNTNIEASYEIARQLRLRDLGGLVVIDYIDMLNPNNQRTVEECLNKAQAMDRARVQIGRISRFGLLEMSRQRLRPSLGESAHQVCPRCVGRGTIRGIESLTLSVLRLVEEDALKENTTTVRVQLPVEMATYMLNEKRHTLLGIEKRHDVTIQVIANTFLETPQYNIERIRTHDQTSGPSYRQVKKPEDELDFQADSTQDKKKISEEPVIKTMPVPHHLHPARDKKRKSLLKRLLSSLLGKKTKKSNKSNKSKKAATKRRTSSKQKPRSTSRHKSQQTSQRRPRQQKPKKQV